MGFDLSSLNLIMVCRCAAKIFQLRVVSGSVSFARRFAAHSCFWSPEERSCDSWHGRQVKQTKLIELGNPGSPPG